MTRLNAIPFVLVLLAAGAPAAAQAPLEGANRLANPSVEEHGPLRRNRATEFDAIPGWFSPEGRVLIHDGNSAGIAAYDGNAKLSLDAGTNTTLVQDVAVDPGRRYRLELFYAPEWNRSRTASNDLDLEWQSLPLARLSGDKRYWRRHVFDLVADDIAARLLLRGAGEADGRGALVDALDLAVVPWASANLVENGSFEDAYGDADESHRSFDRIPGWEAASGEPELRRHGHSGVDPYEGETLLVLDGDHEDTVAQLLDLIPGRRYDLEIGFSPRRSSGGDAVEVWGNGTLITVLDGDRKQWHRRRVIVTPDTTPWLLMLRAPRSSPEDHGHHDDGRNDEDRHGYGSNDRGRRDDDPDRDDDRDYGAGGADGYRDRDRREDGADHGDDSERGKLGGDHDDDRDRGMDDADRGDGRAREEDEGGRDGDRDDDGGGRGDVRSGGGDGRDRDGERDGGKGGEDHDDGRYRERDDGDRDDDRYRRDGRGYRDDDPERGKDSSGPDRGKDGGGRDDDRDKDDRGRDDDHGHGKHGDDRDDDHGHGARNHGGLVDDVRLYAACWAGDNLVVNHSFELHPPLVHRDRGSFLTVPGWRAAAGSVSIHRYGARGRSPSAAEGRDHLSLGGASVVEVVQELATDSGAPYLLEFAYSPQREQPATDRNELEVWWDGEIVATLAGDRPRWRHYRIPVRATGALTEIRFAGVNAREGEGLQLDEVRVLRLADIAIAPEPLPGARDGEPFAYTVALAEAGGVGLVFELAEAPAGMRVDAVSGAIEWPAPVAGTHPLTVRVGDACGRVEEQSFSLTVTGSNSPPEIVSTPVIVTPLFHVRPRITVSDDNPASESVRLNGAPFTSGSAVSADGVHILEVEATDAAGNTATRVLQFTIDRNASP